MKDDVILREVAVAKLELEKMVADILNDFYKKYGVKIDIYVGTHNIDIYGGEEGCYYYVTSEVKL